MMILLALSIVANFEAIGTLLVFGFLVAPPATAMLFARSLPSVMVLAVGFGSISVVGRLTVSHHHGTAAGAKISGVSVVLFFIGLLVKELVRWSQPHMLRAASDRTMQ